MSISLRNVIETLCPDYELESTIKTKTSKIAKYTKSKYTETSQYRQVLQCVYRSLYDDFSEESSINIEIDSKNEFIQTHKFIEILNMRKVMTAISQEIINNYPR